MSYPEKIKFARETLLMTQEEPSIKAKKAFRDLCERKGLSFDENHG